MKHNMNEAQESVAGWTAIAIAAMLVFPPLTGSSCNGYDFIFSLGYCKVNIPLLLLQWLGVLLVGGIFYFIAGRENESNDE